MARAKQADLQADNISTTWTLLFTLTPISYCSHLVINYVIVFGFVTLPVYEKLRKASV
jgi:hypothetical protein